VALRWHTANALPAACRRTDVTLRITFAEAAAVPRVVRLEHAPSATAAFERLGDIPLQPRSLQQLRHLFRRVRGAGRPAPLALVCTGVAAGCSPSPLTFPLRPLPSRMLAGWAEA
jgi:hypothetical protein